MIVHSIMRNFRRSYQKRKVPREWKLRKSFIFQVNNSFHLKKKKNINLEGGSLINHYEEKELPITQHVKDMPKLPNTQQVFAKVFI